MLSGKWAVQMVIGCVLSYRLCSWLQAVLGYAWLCKAILGCDDGY